MRSILLKCLTNSRCTRKYNFIYAHNKNIAFAALMFKELTCAEQHSVRICYTGFHRIRDNKCGK
jgi:hypothetical protein